MTTKIDERKYSGSPALIGNDSQRTLCAGFIPLVDASGRIKALWIMATNPVVSMPDASAVEAALKSCPFVVVSDVMQDTDTTRHAHVLLPLLGWGEKDGTVTNFERRISRQRGYLDASGEATADWWQLAEVGRRMGFIDAFSYSGPADIFAEHASLSAFENGGTRDFDIGAHVSTDSAEYDALSPFQWPQPANTAPITSRFFAEGGFFHPDSKAQFITLGLPQTNRTDNGCPLTLNTGRIRDQWHTMTRTGKSARLSSHIAEPFAELHPRDAMAAGIESADLVEIESPLGRIIVRALVTDRQAHGNVFVPMHWNDQFAANARVDKLVPPITDPFSGQPASKNVAVKAQHFQAKAYAFAVTQKKPQDIDCAYWAQAKADGGYRLEMAFDETPDDWMS